MASGDSDFLENELLDHVLGGAAYTAPATLHLALYTVAPSDAGGGTEVATGDWTDYARLAVTNNLTNFPAAIGGAKSNGVELSWGNATIVTPPEVVAVGILDAASGGNLLKWGDLATPKTINDGDPVSFPAGELDFTHD